MKPAKEKDKRESIEFLQKVALKLRYIGKIVVYGAISVGYNSWNLQQRASLFSPYNVEKLKLK